MSWSDSDYFFVSSEFEVFWIDLITSEPLNLIRRKDVVYDGPTGDDFIRYLFLKDFRVNRQGKAVVRVPKRNNEGEYLDEYDFFILETVVPLHPFGFQNLPLPKPQEVNELQSLLDDTNAELTKKNDVLNELQRKRRWSMEQFRLTITAITKAMKRVFICFGLEPPVSVILNFLEMLRDLILRKEFDATFLGAANEILTSIASIFDQRTGLNIDMETSSTPSTPAHLIKSLNTLRDFMDAHFFIDANTIVRAFNLMNMDDLLVIFRDSASGVAELKRKEIGAKSIDNIDGKSVFYGYFNIPTVGMFKGILTRVHVTLPDEIMVKLQVIGKHTLNSKGFWFVYANGGAIFEKSSSTTINGSQGGNIVSTKLEDVNFTPSRVLGRQTDIFEFLRRMNRTFVDEMGSYIKFDFIASKFSGPRLYFDNTVRYYDKDWHTTDPFSMVQFDLNECATDIVDLQGEVSIHEAFPMVNDDYPMSWIVNQARGNVCAFVFREYCFIGRITEGSGTFRSNALVSVFFERRQPGQYCYVDALATTFFVLKTKPAEWWRNAKKKGPEFIEGRGFPTSSM